MDKLTHYRSVIRQLLNRYAQWKLLNADEAERQTVFDEEHDRYLLLNVGWDNQHHRRIYGTVLHFDIRDDKIWVQENNTDYRLDEDLQELGISPQEIVLGFISPELRADSGFAIG